LSYDDQGDLTVRPSGTQGSGVLTSMSRSNCLVLLNEDLNVVESGDTVTVQPYDVVL
jgi:molybdopterin molybdotransferase